MIRTLIIIAGLAASALCACSASNELEGLASGTVRPMQASRL